MQSRRRMTSFGHRPQHPHRPNYRFDLLPRDHPRPQQNRSRTGQRQNSGLDSDRCSSAIQHHCHSIAQAIANVLRGGGRKFGKTIRARSGDWNSRLANERFRDRICRHSNAHRIQSGRQPVGHMRLFWQHQCQRSRPKFPSQFLGAIRPLANQSTRHFDGTYVNDQRAGWWPPLRRIDFIDRCHVERIGPQPVYGFGGKSHQFARADQLRGPGNLITQANPLSRLRLSSRYA